MKSLRIAFASLALLVFAGCSKEPAAAAAKCPTCGQAAVATVAQVDYMGSKVGFCCEGCATKWKGMSDADKKTAHDKNMK